MGIVSVLLRDGRTERKAKVDKVDKGRLLEIAAKLSETGLCEDTFMISALNGDAYLFGGEATARHAIDSTLHRLDAAAGTWHAISPAHAPPPRVGHAQAVAGGRLYVFGGRASVEMGEAELGDLW